MNMLIPATITINLIPEVEHNLSISVCLSVTLALFVLKYYIQNIVYVDVAFCIFIA